MSQYVSVKDAAAALGLSELTVKRRIKAGTLKGQQEKTTTGFRWLVELPEGISIDTSTPSEDSKDEGWIELVSELRQQNDWFKQELDKRGREVSELHILLRREQEANEQLRLTQSIAAVSSDTVPATSGEAVSDISSTNGHNSPNFSRKGFWARLFKTA
jgi:hypothetical protein